MNAKFKLHKMNAQNNARPWQFLTTHCSEFYHQTKWIYSKFTFPLTLIGGYSAFDGNGKCSSWF